MTDPVYEARVRAARRWVDLFLLLGPALVLAILGELLAALVSFCSVATITALRRRFVDHGEGRSDAARTSLGRAAWCFAIATLLALVSAALRGSVAVGLLAAVLVAAAGGAMFLLARQRQ